jgi:hypothetical protein
MGYKVLSRKSIHMGDASPETEKETTMHYWSLLTILLVVLIVVVIVVLV